MEFRHADQLWQRFPTLAAGMIAAELSAVTDVDEPVRRLLDRAAEQLDGRTEGELPQIQAWRRVYGAMGLKPTQYRCASESLLRRFRRTGEFPRVHPVVDLCNAFSMAYAIPVAAFDRSRIGGDLSVREAVGTERYDTFGGEVEQPAVGEVIFADTDGRAHARRWANRQSGWSAVREPTTDLLVVVEAHHAGGDQDVERLLAELAGELATSGGEVEDSRPLTRDAPSGTF